VAASPPASLSGWINVLYKYCVHLWCGQWFHPGRIPLPFQRRGQGRGLARMAGVEEMEECPECDKMFSDIRTLSDHFDKEHGSDEEVRTPQW